LSTAPTASNFETVLSQSAGSFSAFELQARPAGWCLNTPAASAPTTDHSVCGGTVTVGVWTHVAVQFDNSNTHTPVFGHPAAAPAVWRAGVHAGRAAHGARCGLGRAPGVGVGRAGMAAGAAARRDLLDDRQPGGRQVPVRRARSTGDRRVGPLPRPSVHRWGV